MNRIIKKIKLSNQNNIIGKIHLNGMDNNEIDIDCLRYIFDENVYESGSELTDLVYDEINLLLSNIDKNFDDDEIIPQMDFKINNDLTVNLIFNETSLLKNFLNKYNMDYDSFMTKLLTNIKNNIDECYIADTLECELNPNSESDEDVEIYLI